MRIIQPYLIMVLFTCYSCGGVQKNEAILSTATAEEQELPHDALNFEKNNSIEVQAFDAINQKDKNGLKQGVWETYRNGKIWKRENYKDDQLHGKQYEYHGKGEVTLTAYRLGVIEGYQLRYHTDSSFANFISYYENGKHLWSAFPWELCDYIVPVKGFLTEEQRVEIRVPYNSGQRMYVGTVVNTTTSGIVPIGIHKAYYETGELKALVNYDQDSIYIYNVRGNKIFSDRIKQWKGRRVSSL